MLANYPIPGQEKCRNCEKTGSLQSSESFMQNKLAATLGNNFFIFAMKIQVFKIL